MGSDGDFYIDTARTLLFGPKTSGAWPHSYVSLVGPQGDTGATGPAGPTVVTLHHAYVASTVYSVATAACPAGQVLTGGGAALDNSAGLAGARLLAAYPGPSNTYMAISRSPADGGYLTAFALCAG